MPLRVNTFQHTRRLHLLSRTRDKFINTKIVHDQLIYVLGQRSRTLQINSYIYKRVQGYRSSGLVELALILKWLTCHLQTLIKCFSPAKAPKTAVEFNNVNVDNSDYFTTSTFNNVVRSQVGNFFIMHENIRSFRNFFEELHSFASELNRAADVIVLSETWFSANTCHGVQGYTGFHTYRADKRGGGVSVFIRNCYTSAHRAKFSVCHACIL